MSARKAVISSSLPAPRCIEGIRHTASLYAATLNGGPVQFTISLKVAYVNPRLVTDLGAEAMGGVDPGVRLRIVVAPSTPTVIEIESETPLYYFTGAYGFDSDAVSSFSTTLDAMLDHYATGSRKPPFPAPPRPPAE